MSRQFDIVGTTLLLSGDFTIDAMQGNKKALEAVVSSCVASQVTKVDWNLVGGVDSTALAWTLWLQSLLSEPLIFVNVPSKLATLMGLYDLSSVFSVEAPNT